MALNREFNTAVAAGQAGIRINTDEIVDALAMIKASCEKRKHPLTFWDKAYGAKGAFVPAPEKPRSLLPGMDMGPTPLATLESVIRRLVEDKTIRAEDDASVYVVTNFQVALEGPRREELISLTQHAVSHGKLTRQFLVLLMPGEAKLPPEIAPLFHTIEHEIPDEAELMAILMSCCTETQRPPEDAAKAAAKSALGLTRLQAEGAFASSLVLKQKIDPHTVWEAKAHQLATEGLVEIKAPKLSFADVGGLDGLKDLLERLLEPEPLEEVDPDARAKGVMCVGAPGVGKSLMAECLGKELGLPIIMFNPGNLMGEFVGITERNTRRFFQVIRRLAPCIVVGDEIGQQMGGGQPGQPGHQVDARMLGTFLTNMSEIQEPVFWFFTANDISSMHEAFARAERVDAKVYVRLPGPDQLAQVWRIYIKKFFPKTIKGQPNPRYVSPDLDAHVKAIKAHRNNADPDVRSLIRTEAAAMLMTLPVAERRKALSAIDAISAQWSLEVEEMLIKDDRWTPAEVRACCRLALRLKLPLHLAARRVGHVCIGPKGDALLAALDEWAVNDGAIDSETGEVFKPEQKSDAKRRRVRSDDPESN